VQAIKKARQETQCHGRAPLRVKRLNQSCLIPYGDGKPLITFQSETRLATSTDTLDKLVEEE
jgi:hypothetical protein